MQRLEFALESGHFFQQLAASHCPRCGQPLKQDETCHPETSDFAAIESASRAEIKKLAPRIKELQTTLGDVLLDAATAERDTEHWSAVAMQIDKDIREVANPTAAAARSRVRALANRRRELEQHLLRFRELDRYLAIKQEADIGKRQAVDSYQPARDAAALISLQNYVRAVLDEWHLSPDSDVVYDVKADDLVIDGKRRAANGKGVRAVTHAAFKVGLMRHCFAKETPHAGFVVIDSPLTPFRGSARDDEVNPEREAEVRFATLQSLAAHHDTGQCIVIDNIDPPPGLVDAAEVVVFSGLEGEGRRGFYPG